MPAAKEGGEHPVLREHGDHRRPEAQRFLYQILPPHPHLRQQVTQREVSVLVKEEDDALIDERP